MASASLPRTTPRSTSRRRDALHAVDSKVTLGGPSWQSARNDTIVAWPDRPLSGGPLELDRPLPRLPRRSGTQVSEFGFFSFEWYPFDDACTDTGPQLAQAPAILAAALEELRSDGLADSIPRIMTEYGYSAFGGPADVEISSALLNSEAVAGFFSHGGSEAYVYGIEPGTLLKEPHCARWGNNLLFLGDDDRQAKYRMPTYSRRLAADPRLGRFQRGASTRSMRQTMRPTGSHGDVGLVSAYPLQRPDGRWSLLLVNRDPRHAWLVRRDRRARCAGIRPAARGATGSLAVLGRPVPVEGEPERKVTRCATSPHRIACCRTPTSGVVASTATRLPSWSKAGSTPEPVVALVLGGTRPYL